MELRRKVFLIIFGGAAVAALLFLAYAFMNAVVGGMRH
jgi:hypothetical protein